MTTPIPNCPQPETPIRDRAWTDEQLTDMRQKSFADYDVYQDVKELLSKWPYVMCVCGRNHMRVPAELRERLQAAMRYRDEKEK